MFKSYFFLGIISAAASVAACMIYTNVYFGMLVDFSEAATPTKIISSCVAVAMAATILSGLFRKLIPNARIADFLVSLMLSLASIGAVFYVLGADDPTFKNEDAAIMADYFKGFLMPMLFFPALTWFTFKPLFVKL